MNSAGPNQIFDLPIPSTTTTSEPIVFINGIAYYEREIDLPYVGSTTTYVNVKIRKSYN